MQTKHPGMKLNTNGHQRRQRFAGANGAQPTTYYGRPMLKKPTWKWYIPLYFFVGGVAGGSAVLGAAADFFGGTRHRSTVRYARYLALPLSLLSAGLLIIDLGRPTRFHHMLRVFKGSSPLNVGTWILSTFGAVSGFLAVRQAAEDDLIVRRQSWLGRLVRAFPARPFSAAHGLLGLGLGGYTGTLLAATAVPLWAAGGILLGPFFLVSAIATGAAALSFLGALRGRDTVEAREDIEQVENLAIASQLALVAAREVLMPANVKGPLRRGPWAWVWQVGALGAGMVSPLALRLGFRLGGWHLGRALSLASSALSLLGGVAERFALTEAGKASAEDPLAYQAMTAGKPGEARPTAQQQAAQAANAPLHKGRLVTPDC